MRSGGQDVNKFRAEAESFRIQPGQDLNSHLDLMRASIERWLNIEHMELKLLQLGSKATSSDPDQNLGASMFILDHPEVAYDNSYDSTDAEIQAKGPNLVILLSEAKRFTLYSNSVKSSPRFKNIVLTMHAADESSRTVKALITSLRNFELSNFGGDLLKEERKAHPNYKKEIKTYLDLVYLKKTESEEDKFSNFTEKDMSHDKSSHTDEREPNWPMNKSEVQEGDIPHCSIHPNSRTHWTWECSVTIKNLAEELNDIDRSEPTGKDLIGGCFYCYIHPKLAKNCMNHTWANCYFDPKNKGKSISANHLYLKDNNKRPREEEDGHQEEDGEEEGEEEEAASDSSERMLSSDD